MTVEQLARKLDEIISPDMSEPWDNDGRMVVPCPEATVEKVLCTLECTSESIKIAKETGCNVIVTHHPLVFKPLGAIYPLDCVAKRVIECIKNDIAVLSYHTRLDIMEGGVNDMLAELVGMENIQSFVPYGRIGDIKEQSFEDFVKLVSDRLDIDKNEMRLVKAADTVKRVAVISGCGKDEINDVIAAGADTFITGEVMHNHMVECKEQGLNLICATHYGTERFVSNRLGEIMKELGLVYNIYDFVRENEYGI